MEKGLIFIQMDQRWHHERHCSSKINVNHLTMHSRLSPTTPFSSILFFTSHLLAPRKTCSISTSILPLYIVPSPWNSPLLYYPQLIPSYKNTMHPSRPNSKSIPMKGAQLLFSSENRFNCVSSWVTSPCHTFYGISHQGEKIAFSKILEIRLNSKSYSYFYFTVKKSEVESLVILFHGLVGKPDERLDNARLDRSTFRMVLHGLFGMTDDKLMNRGKKS